MNNLSVGYGRVNVTPMMGIGISGYYVPRKAKGVLDDLEVCALSLSAGGKRVCLVCVDVAGLKQGYSLEIRKSVEEALGIPQEAVFLSATHTHTGPFTPADGDSSDPLVKEYAEFLKKKVVDAVRFAVADETPARMGVGRGTAPGIAFIRRYRMKDGSIRTNPGVNNPEILHPIGEVEEGVNVLRFEREDGQNLVLVHFGCHPDVVGGELISADWPGLTRRTVEKVLDGTRAIFFNGAQGDVNHVNVHPGEGFLNDTFHDFDDVSRGYGHARYMARVVTGAVLQAYDKVAWQEVDSVDFAHLPIRVPSQRPRPEDLPEAHRIHDLHTRGLDSELPYRGMMLTTVVAEAARMVRLENGPDFFDMTLSAVRIGNVAFAGFPGEPFTGIGRGVKDHPGFRAVLPCCATCGYQGYFPMKDSYEEGGYEARSSNFKSGVAELFIEKMNELLDSIR